MAGIKSWIPQIPISLKRLCTSPIFTSKKACSAWIATSSRIRTATESYTQSRAPRSNWTARTATAPSIVAQPWFLLAPHRRRVELILRLCVRLSALVALSTALENYFSAPWCKKEKNGKLCRSSTRSRQATNTSTRNHNGQKQFAPTARLGATFPLIPRSSRIPIVA